MNHLLIYSSPKVWEEGCGAGNGGGTNDDIWEDEKHRG